MNIGKYSFVLALYCHLCGTEPMYYPGKAAFAYKTLAFEAIPHSIALAEPFSQLSSVCHF
jgi:hypothetical protein